MIDPVDMVRQVAPPVEAPPELLERVRNDLMTTINRSEHAETKRPSRRRRRWAVPIAAMAVIATAAAGWAAAWRDSPTSIAIECPAGPNAKPGDIALMNAVTGDPVVDCADSWRRTYRTDPPPMTAYVDGGGNVRVLLDSEPVPDGYVAREPGQHQDTTLIELHQALDDVATGLWSRCHDEPGARVVTQRVLADLGLTDWTVTVDDDRPPTGLTDCAYVIVRPDQHQVQLFAGGTGGGTAVAKEYSDFAVELHDRLSSACLGLDAAADLTRSLAATTEVVGVGPIDSLPSFALYTIDDPSAACTRVNVTFTSRPEVMLRGPTD